MLMVVIALVVTTVLTTAILTTPDRLAPVADNKASSAAARWSAVSASNFTVAAIEEDLRAESMGGVFKDGWSFAGGNVTSVVTDLEGNVPDADDRVVVVTITSDEGGITRTVQRRITLFEPYDAEVATDPRLGELAVYAVDAFAGEDVKIANWWASPEARRGEAKLALGVTSIGNATASRVSVSGGVVMTEDTAPGVEMCAESQGCGVMQLPISLPVSHQRQPSIVGLVDHVITSLSDLLDGVLTGTLGGRVSVDLGANGKYAVPEGRYERLRVDDTGEATLANATYAFDEVKITGGGTLRVSGDVRLVVFDRLDVHGLSQIVLDDDARLSLWVGREAVISDSTIGPWDGLASKVDRNIKELNTYTPPARLRFEMDTGSRLTIVGRSIVFGSIHAPASEVVMQDAALVGRLTGGDVTLSDSYVLYDPALDPGYGFTDLEGPLYHDDGRPIDGLDALIESGRSLNPDDLHIALRTLLEEHWSVNGLPNISASGYSGIEDVFIPVELLESEDKDDELYELERLKQTYLADSDSELARQKLEAIGAKEVYEMTDDGK
ncbi:MAG: hypothetical protein Tsb0013_15070 [Phycisphaerales bacterium]